MGLVWLRAQSEWRRHVWRFVALTILVTLVGAVVLTAVSGARRTRSSVTRLDQTTHAFDAFAVFQPGEWNAARAVTALPQVEASDRFSPMSLFYAHGSLPIVASIDGHTGHTLQRDRVLRGRRPNVDATLEISLSEPLAARLGLDLGGRLPIIGISKRQSACAFDEREPHDPRCTAFQKAFFADQPDFSAFAGPRVTLRVVGITRGIADVSARPDDLGLLFLTPAFYRLYHDDVATQPGIAVRFRAGITPQEFEAAVAKVVRPGAIRDSSNIVGLIDVLQSTVSVLANGLVAFAAAAALAGFAAVAQVFARRSAGGSTEHTVLRALGMDRRRLTIDAVAPLVPVAVVGAALSAIIAWWASPLMPIGTARRIEPRPGLHFDAEVLVGGAALILVGVIGIATLCELWTSRRRATRTSRRRVSGAWPFRSVPATVGSRMAFDSGRGRNGIPLRSALSGVAVGIAGIVAVTTFGAGLSRLGHEPARYGWAWDTMISGERASDPDAQQPEPKPTSPYWQQQADRIAADHDVVGVTRMWLGYQTRIAGQTVTAFSQRSFYGSTGFAIVSGRAPSAVDEVALGAKTMRRAHLDVGDRVRVQNRSMSVVGRAIFPVTDDGYAFADGVLLSAEGFEQLGLGNSSGLGSTGFTTFAVTLAKDADRSAAMTRMKALNRGDAPGAARTPPEVDQLQQLDRLPLVLAGFLLVVALLALAHVLVLTVRRRRPDLAVLRTIGLTPAQAARTVAWQAATLAVCGVIVGVPVGLVLGRLVWSTVADSYGIATDVAWPWLALALTLPAAVLFACAIAWLPGRRAARIKPAVILRSE